MKKILMGLALLTIALTACNSSQTKDTEDSPSIQDIMEGHRWRISAITSDKALDFNLDGTKSKDIHAQNNPCSKDDIFTFGKNSLLTLDEGEIICQARDTDKGRWNTDDSNLQLTLPQTAPINFKVVSRSEDQVVVQSASPITRDKALFTYTFSKVD